MGENSVDRIDVEKYKMNCKKFNGYKPCSPYKVCNICGDFESRGERILVVGLMGLGSVLMISAVLEPLSKMYPNGEIYFLTSAPGKALLMNNPYIHEVLGWDTDNLIYLSQIKFNIAINYDRSKKAAAFSNIVKADKKLGFYLQENGAITYKGKEFEFLYSLGLDDENRFHVNQKSMAQIMVESLGIAYEHNPYRVYLSKEQRELEAQIVEEKGISKEYAIGINTGCSPLMINRSFPKETLTEIIKILLEQNEKVQVLLLGGKDEKELNEELARIGERVIDLTNTVNLSYGICCEDISKVVLSGCSFGLHLGIALGKPCVAWFGPSCEQEVELFFGGKKFKSDMNCSPCWQKQCTNEVKCNTCIPTDEIVQALLMQV